MAEPLRRITGLAYPLGLANVDTDMIIPAEYMKTTTRSGLAIGAFETLRGIPGNVFDDGRWADAPILIAGANFGCGSSREHAVWALVDLGIRTIIAPSFADIFAGNALRNGILAISLDEGDIDRLIEVAQSGTLDIDLEAQLVLTADLEPLSFEIDPFHKQCLISGLDEIALTLERETKIRDFERSLAGSRPWIEIASHEPSLS